MDMEKATLAQASISSSDHGPELRSSPETQKNVSKLSLRMKISNKNGNPRNPLKTQSALKLFAFPAKILIREPILAVYLGRVDFKEYSCDEAHFWLNGYVNKQNCRIWSEANPQVYVETPLHPEKLTVWCALWAGGIFLQKR
ncbi:hypothetical protein TNCV_3235361 [Trichonephila clavipes]|nr:hypothetical protein TNCV_3235361 [Trichonephila clavipes]